MSGAFRLGAVAAAIRSVGGGNPVDPGDETDPYFANVAALMHFDGANGSTIIVDSSSHSQVVSLENSAAISTAQSKFGGSSLSPGAAVIADVASLRAGVGDFTAEEWVYTTAKTGGVFTICAGGFSTKAALSFYNAGANAGLFFEVGNTGTITTATGVVPLSTWTHIALVREGDDHRLYVNGLLVGSATTGPANMTNGTTWVGRSGYGGYLAGYIDDFRLTIGVARYSGNFTPPAAPFPNA